MPWGVAIGAIGSIASSAIGSAAAGEAAGEAAGLQKEYLDLGINELRGALGPSMTRLDEANAWSDRLLRGEQAAGMRETDPYRRTGRRAMNRLNFMLGDAGPAPRAPGKAPKAPTYKGWRPGGNGANPMGRGLTQAGGPGRPADFRPNKRDFKDPKDYQAAVVQFQKYKKDTQAYNKANAQYQADSAAHTARLNDPNLGSFMKPYEDRFEDRITDVSQRQFNDKYASEILDVGRDKFDAEDFTTDPGYEFRRSEGNRGVEQSAAAGGSLQSGATLKALTRFNQDTASNEFDRAHGRWADVRNTRLGTLKGQQGFDYNVFDRQKGTELDTLTNQRNFDFGNFEDNRNFQYGALSDQVQIGQDAVDDRNQLRQYFGGTRSQNNIANAVQQGNWQQNTANNVANFLSQQGDAQATGVVGAANAQTSAYQGIGNAIGTGLGYYTGQQRTGSGQRRQSTTHQGANSPEWWQQNRGVPT